MIIITGAAGFIGSALIAKLNQENYNDLVAVDDFNKIGDPEVTGDKAANLEGKKITARVPRDKFFVWLAENHKQVQFIFHLGARTDTTEFDTELLTRLNLDYTKKVWAACCTYGIPLVYASSAATYGGGEFGYDDDPGIIDKLQPLNPYGVSKNEFDKWALSQEKKPYYWVGLKFFNVYGPNEYHKGRMASVIMHTYNQVKQTGAMKLFRSHNPDFKDGEQMRDFVYVKDVTDVLFFLMHHRIKANSGIYNLGSGKTRTFLDLVKCTFAAMQVPENISFTDTPADIRDKYQYFTEARMARLRQIGYEKPFTSLEDGIADYVNNYLTDNCYL
jgi:ADP-L-glycero-D-manno-heptose 6-epimerase